VDFADIVLYCDNHLLVVDKPAGMLSQSDRTKDVDIVSAGKGYLKTRFRKPGNVFLGLVHRLDRPVSGVMVLARTSKAAARLSRQFRLRDVEKRYVAVVEGSLSTAGERVGYQRASAEGVTAATVDDEDAQYSELSWVKIASTSKGSIVSISLVTGRKHQIRHQFSEMGHPIVGDRRYGASTPFDGRNIALHCYSLDIDHPTQKKRMGWFALPPTSWGEDRIVIADWIARVAERSP
jgi:RluA family pseudouridine synthase